MKPNKRINKVQRDLNAAIQRAENIISTHQKAIDLADARRDTDVSLIEAAKARVEKEEETIQTSLQKVTDATREKYAAEKQLELIADLVTDAISVNPKVEEK